MKNRLVALAVALALFVAGTALAEKAAKKVTSGPQVGDELPGPFHPLNVTGAQAGKKNCMYCEHGANPVAMVFAREVTPELTTLLKKLDAATAKHSDCKMGSFVVFLNDAEGLEATLKKVAKDAGLKKVVLTIDNPAGPKGYKVSKDADVTVVLYVDQTVKANHAFKKGEMKSKDVDTILADVAKILPKKDK